jgi:hypothetical protein
MTPRPKVSEIKRQNGVAGQIAYSTTVTYPDESPTPIQFVGNVSGGPVVMVTAGGQTFVSDPGRFGKFGPTWVRRFLGVEDR